MDRKIRVLLFKPGLDGHWRGIITVAQALVDAGMEVIFGGHKSIEGIVEVALQEDVDVIGLSILSGSHLEWTEKLMEALKREGCDKDEFLILVGGVFPPEDFQKLKDLGAHGVFGPGTSTAEIIDFIRDKLRRQAIQPTL